MTLNGTWKLSDPHRHTEVCEIHEMYTPYEIEFLCIHALRMV